MYCPHLDISIETVCSVYSGPGGMLWELLMGEEIHVGGAAETDILAKRVGITAASSVLDVCSAVGGPARHLARQYGCHVVGLDATPSMVEEAVQRTAGAGLVGRVSFRLGNALDMPFHANTFDVAWGQDAWCYVTDKARLLHECARVVRPGGAVAFTDWLQTGPMDEAEWTRLGTFTAFPYLESLDGYVALAEAAGLKVVEKKDLSPDFARSMQHYLEMVRGEKQDQVTRCCGREAYGQVLAGITAWRDAAVRGSVGRGRIVAKKR